MNLGKIIKARFIKKDPLKTFSKIKIDPYSMTPAQQQKEMKRSKSIIRRYIAPILFAIAFVSGKGAFLGEGVFMCPHVELGLCCKNFEVMDDHKLGKDCKFVMTSQIQPFLCYVFEY